MKKAIIEVLKENHDFLPIDELAKKMRFKNLQELNQHLNDLKEENQVVITDQQNLYLLKNDKYYLGTLRMNPRGFGFVNDILDVEKESYFVPPTAMKKAINDDEIVFKISKESDGRFRAEVQEIAHRNKEFLIGEISKSRDGRFLDFLPTDLAFSNFRIVMINKSDFKLEPNQLFKAKILEVKDRKLFVRLKKMIGNSTKAADRILSIAEEFNVPTEFLPNTLNFVRTINIPVDQEVEELKKRQPNSLVDKLLVTIDGKDSKDLDDSIYVEKTGNGYKLFVAIADVSHYVQPKTPLDNEALMRGNSTYLANMVLPMLPKVLSDDLCSLNPKTKKLVMVSEMDFNDHGQMISKKVYESIIISQARLNYDEVNEYFANKTWNHDPKIAKMLDQAHELHLLLDKRRAQQGMLNLDVREPKVIMDENSNVIEIKARQTGTSEQLIENFMVGANEAVAELIFEKAWPFIYRNHAKPDDQDLIDWYTTIKSFGIDPKLTPKEMLDPLNINKTLNQINLQITDSVEKELLNLSLLRHLQKAEYGLKNIGHFGLASQCYTHFTSPIRRYADLMVHRYLKQYLIDKDFKEANLERNTAFIQKASKIINATEITSVDCEREVVKVCMVEYMHDKVGQTFEGTIAVALKFGFFVQLENMVEGLVHISTLGDGLTYDEKTYTLIKADNTFYRMGQKVKVKLIGVDIKKRTIDFALI